MPPPEAPQSLGIWGWCHPGLHYKNRASSILQLSHPRAQPSREMGSVTFGGIEGIYSSRPTLSHAPFQHSETDVILLLGLQDIVLSAGHASPGWSIKLGHFWQRWLPWEVTPGRTAGPQPEAQLPHLSRPVLIHKHPSRNPPSTTNT